MTHLREHNYQSSPTRTSSGPEDHTLYLHQRTQPQRVWVSRVLASGLELEGCTGCRVEWCQGCRAITGMLSEGSQGGQSQIEARGVSASPGSRGRWCSWTLQTPMSLQCREMPAGGSSSPRTRNTCESYWSVSPLS